ncbi:hypothetical protein BGX33_002088, partial [Mortierella sp. NVP41]
MHDVRVEAIEDTQATADNNDADSDIETLDAAALEDQARKAPSESRHGETVASDLFLGAALKVPLLKQVCIQQYLAQRLAREEQHALLIVEYTDWRMAARDDLSAAKLAKKTKVAKELQSYRPDCSYSNPAASSDPVPNGTASAGPEEDDGVTVAINSKDLRHGAIEDAMGMKRIPVYTGTRDTEYKRVTNIAIKGLSQLVIPILTGHTTNKILQFVTAVNLFLMSYKRIIDLR